MWDVGSWANPTFDGKNTYAILIYLWFVELEHKPVHLNISFQFLLKNRYYYSYEVILNK